MDSYTVNMNPSAAHLYFIFFLGRWMQFAVGNADGVDCGASPAAG